MVKSSLLAALGSALGLSTAFEYYTFDGPGAVACHNVVEVHNATSVDDMVDIVKSASSRGLQVRAGGKGHMWYDTQCSDDATVMIRTEFVNGISNFDLDAGTVEVEGGVTFFELADYLHARGANIGTGLVNWNITLGGSVAMGAHRTSLKSDAVVVGGVLALDIIDGNGNIQHIEKDETNDDWLAASCSLGLLGIIARLKMQIYPETKVYAMQQILNETDVLNGDIYGMISPYMTANFWWWPHTRKFHYRYYDPIPDNTSTQEGFQSTFSLTAVEAGAALTLLDSGKLSSIPNIAAEATFFAAWSLPNFHEKTTNQPILTWPVYGYNYDVLIGGQWPGEDTEWDYGLHGYTLELAFPVTQANKMLQRVRALFDAEEAKGMPMTSTYRSGINIKFGKAHNDLLGQVTTLTPDGADWSQGAIMFDFPTFKPNYGDEKRYNEPFYINLANTLIDEFPCRPHWTKNTRDVFTRAVKNLDADNLARFKAVRRKFDPNGLYRSVVGEILGLYP